MISGSENDPRGEKSKTPIFLRAIQQNVPPIFIRRSPKNRRSPLWRLKKESAKNGGVHSFGVFFEETF